MSVPHKYVGRCIYCDSTERLTDEHVIPEGLKGNLILREASCVPCQKITCAIEGQVLGKMMGHFRAATGMRRKDRRTKTCMVALDDGSRVELDVSASPVLMLPAYGEPGFIGGRDIGAPALVSFPLQSSILAASLQSSTRCHWPGLGLTFSVKCWPRSRLHSPFTKSGWKACA